MANLKALLQKLVSGSDEHKWNDVAPDCVALIFVRYPENGRQSGLGQQALVCNQYPITQTEANEYRQRFYEPEWRYVGHIFSYRNPEGGTQFEAHPDTEFGEEKWIQMLKAPVLGTGLTYREKIMCRLTGISYNEYLAAEG